MNNPLIIAKIEEYLKQQSETGNYFFVDKETQGKNIISNYTNESKNSIIKEPDAPYGITVPEAKDLFDTTIEWKSTSTVAELKSKIENCKNCTLGSTRKNFVFGSGNPKADIMVIGEAPGADEDEQGLPFVGRAGQLLTKILESINLKRDDVFICNILKCRPPNNRNPLPSEVEQCEPYLKKQIDLIKPQFILALGLTAVDTLLKKKHRMMDIRGSIHNYHGIKMLVTFHPAALLRNPNWKVQVWEDVKLLRKMYDEFLSTK